MMRALAIAAILLAAGLAGPGEAAPPGRTKPDPARVKAWEQAKARADAMERELERARWREQKISEAGHSIDEELCAGREIAGALEERTDAIGKSAAAAAAVATEAPSALEAADAHFAAGQAALQAGLRFSSATAGASEALARDADRLADAALERRAAADRSVERTEREAGELRDALARAERAHDAAARDLAMLRKSAPALSAALRDALTPPAGARAPAQALVLVARALPCRQRASRPPAPAAPDGDLEAALRDALGAGGQWTEAAQAISLDAGFSAAWKGRPALLTSSHWRTFDEPRRYRDARTAEMVEVRAHAFVAALERRCGGDRRCLKRLRTTAADSQQALATAAGATAQRRQAADQAIAALQPGGQALLALAQKSQPDHGALGPALAVLEQMQGAVGKAEALARREAAKAEREHDIARAAANAAHLAAFGRPAPAPARLAQSQSALMHSQALASMAAPRVQGHVYELVTRSRDAPEKAYGAYTYVLFPLRGAIPAESRSRYQALLTAIVSTTLHASRVRIDPAKLNVFCIPSRIDQPKDESRFDLADYDGALSLAQLATAGAGAITRPDILDSLRFSPGPFLLTTYAPLEKVRSDSPMLFLDLSGFPPGTYRDLVAGYKAALVSEPPAGQDAWDPGTVRWAFSKASVLYADGKAVYSRVKDMLGVFFPSEAKTAGGQRVALVR